MRVAFPRVLSIWILSFAALPLFAQSETGSNSWLTFLVIAAVIAFLFGIIVVIDNLMQVEAVRSGADPEKANFRFFPK